MSTLIASATTFYIVIMLCQSYRKNRVKNTLYLMSFFLFLAIHNVFFLVAMLAPTYELAVFFFRFSFLGPVGVFFSLVFAESLKKPSPITIHTYLSSLLLIGAIVDGFFTHIIIGLGESTWYAIRLRSIYGYTALFLLYIYVCVIVIYTFYLMYKKSESKVKRSQTRGLLVASIVGFLGSISIVILEFVTESGFVLEFLAIGVASSIIGFYYNKNPYVSYLLIQDIYKVMVIEQSGVLCFSKNLHPSYKIDDSATAGLIIAILSFGSEILELEPGKSDLNIFAFGDKKVIVKNHKNIYGVIISNNVSIAMINALDRFTKKFYEEFVIYLKDSGLILTPKEADELLNNEFSMLLP